MISVIVDSIKLMIWTHWTDSSVHFHAPIVGGTMYSARPNRSRRLLFEHFWDISREQPFRP